MTIYLIMFLFAEIFAFLSVYYNNRVNAVTGELPINIHKWNRLQSKFWLWISAIPFFLIAALRYRVGTDYSVYMDMQIPQLLRGIDYKLKYEYLYQAVIKLGMAISGYQLVFILTHLILLFFIWKSFENLSADLCFSVFIFMFGAFYNTSLNIMRQSIAMAVFLYSIKFIVRRDFRRFLIMIIIAFLFHKSAIIFLPLYWLPEIKLSDKVAIGSAVIVGILAEPIRVLIVGISNFTGLYSMYFNSQFDINNRQWDFALFNFVLLLMILYIRKYLSNQEPINTYRHTIIRRENVNIFENTMFNLQLLTVYTSVLSNIIPNSTRIIFMFSVGQMIYIPFVVQRIRNNTLRRVIIATIVVMYLVLFTRLILMRNIGDTRPYHFISMFNF
ncbi:EpsG family protein [Lactiplantibacillus plantarum]|uniref:EpsG family protein n=1 Tax=Lactiplantibacillus plantarum TaxID=1590 RepID=UPI001CCC428D|nr:EpsG family protein [Lactiplantibacillus plantarum]MDN7020674.1 EpsG family protein [Lactiplantibacillus plantarum]